MLEQQLRHAKYHDTAYNLEPNIKEGPGGLRDMQVITWVFKRHYNSKTLRELIQYGFLPESEYNQLISALHVLWRIRYALHLLTRPQRRPADFRLPTGSRPPIRVQQGEPAIQ